MRGAAMHCTYASGFHGGGTHRHLGAGTITSAMKLRLLIAVTTLQVAQICS